jgi:hypothetical protein
MYNTPLTMSGIDWLARNGSPSFFKGKLQARTSFVTLLVFICFSVE